MFPGGGAQYAGHGRGALRARAGLSRRRSMRRCRHRRAGAAVASCGRLALAEPRRRRGGRAQRLEAPSRALPALFATEYAVAKLLRVVGHRAGGDDRPQRRRVRGRLPGGVMSLRDAVALVVAARPAVRDACRRAACSACSCRRTRRGAHRAPSCRIAAVNAPDAVRALGPGGGDRGCGERRSRARGVDCTRVHIRVAAHSSMLEPILPSSSASAGRSRSSRPTGAVRLEPHRHLDHATPKPPTRPTGCSTCAARCASPTACRRCSSRASVALLEVGPGRDAEQPGAPGRRRRACRRRDHPDHRHAQEEASDVAFLLGAVGRLWPAASGSTSRGCLPASACAACAADLSVRAPAVLDRRRDPDDGRPRAPRQAAETPDVADGFPLPSWARSAPPPRPSDAPARGWCFARRRRCADAIVGTSAARRAQRGRGRAGAAFSARHRIALRHRSRQSRRITTIWPEDFAAPRRVAHAGAASASLGACASLRRGRSCAGRLGSVGSAIRRL